MRTAGSLPAGLLAWPALALAVRPPPPRCCLRPEAQPEGRGKLGSPGSCFAEPPWPPQRLKGTAVAGGRCCWPGPAPSPVT